MKRDKQQKQQVVWKVARLLDLFTPESPEWRVGEVAQALEVPKTTASELMTTLAEQRLLRRSHNGRYRLGWRLFELSQNLLETSEFRAEAQSVIDELVEGYGETVHLAVLDNMQAVYIEKRQPTPAVKIMASRAGGRLHAHCCGVGKMLLSACEWDHVQQGLEHQGMPAFTPNTIVTPEAMAEELEGIRSRGYAFDLEEALQGLCCVAAPVLNSEGEVVAALSISAPAFRYEEHEAEYTRAVLGAARRISEGAGYTMDGDPGDVDLSDHGLEGRVNTPPSKEGGFSANACVDYRYVDCRRHGPCPRVFSSWLCLAARITGKLYRWTRLALESAANVFTRWQTTHRNLANIRLSRAFRPQCYVTYFTTERRCAGQGLPAQASSPRPVIFMEGSRS